MALQEENNLPRTQLQKKPIKEMANNHIGDMFPLDRHPAPCPQWDEDWSFTHVKKLGLKWVRVAVDWMDFSQVESSGQYSQSEINTCQDEMVSGLADNNITIMLVITYWDETLHVEEGYPRYHKEIEIQHYLDYARSIVHHFKGRVQYYEILNEPLHNTPQQHVELADYINLIRRVVPVIHEEDPEAKVVVGGATDLRHDYSHDYFFEVIQSDAMPLVDAISTHPMYGVSPQYDEVRQYYYDYPSLVQKIKDTASAHGFKGEYFAEEMVWRTNINPNPYEPFEYSFIEAAKYYARGIIINLGLDFWAGIGGEKYDITPPIVKVVQNLSSVMSGVRPESVSMEIQTDAQNLVTFTFQADNGDRLVAIWADSNAVDEDPGVPATLLISGFADWKASAMDPLNGIEQPLITDTENSNLILSKLSIKDYPIIIRLSKPD